MIKKKGLVMMCNVCFSFFVIEILVPVFFLLLLDFPPFWHAISYREDAINNLNHCCVLMSAG